LDLIHNTVLKMLRLGQSEKNIRYLLSEELEHLSTASEYMEAMKESDLAP
jgi:hypothetical protein